LDMTSATMKKLPFFLPFGGCEGRCVYCNQRVITGTCDVPSPEYIRSVLSKLDEPREICYFGGSFCRFARATIKAYLDAVIECAPPGSRIRFSTYPGDLRDAELRELVMSYPIACVELGVPSLDPSVLRSCKRDADPNAIMEDLTTLRDESVSIAVQMMIGLPGQTEESSMNDLALMADVKGPVSWELRLYPCLVLEGTELLSMFKSGLYRPISVLEAVRWGGKFIDAAVEMGFCPIRVGLQESDLLASQVRGGPHHPALGEMIQSEALVRKLTRNSWTGPWTVPASQMSKFTGHGAFGLSRLAYYTGLSIEKAASLLRYFPRASCR